MTRRLTLALVTFLAPMLLLTGVVWAGWKNLKVLPDDLPDKDLSVTMQRMSEALGVDCSHCHSSAAAPEADDNAKKDIARRMIRMTVALNRDQFDYPNAPMVTCMTCHRGKAVPDHKTKLPEPVPDPPPVVPGEEEGPPFPVPEPVEPGTERTEPAPTEPTPTEPAPKPVVPDTGTEPTPKPVEPSPPPVEPPPPAPAEPQP